MEHREMGKPRRIIIFRVSGSSGTEYASDLRRLLEEWESSPSEHISPSGLEESLPLVYGQGPLEIIVTDPGRETSVSHCLRYAMGELQDGIVAAGGHIWDGTHVQIILRDSSSS